MGTQPSSPRTAPARGATGRGTLVYPAARAEKTDYWPECQAARAAIFFSTSSSFFIPMRRASTKLSRAIDLINER